MANWRSVPRQARQPRSGLAWSGLDLVVLKLVKAWSKDDWGSEVGLAVSSCESAHTYVSKLSLQL